ncbi:hypothetical protein ACFWW5_20975 [Streptomyces albidoflavus]|uniref:hypothetical protein n=1 Tax=Streptomyces albidoflavus TaxID=1886 RepID=UPI0033E1EC31
MNGLNETVATGLALGVGANMLYAVGTHGKTKAKQALLWLIHREKNRDTMNQTLAAFGPDADELADTYDSTLGTGWNSNDYRDQVEAKTPAWAGRLAAHLMAHPDALDDFRAFEVHGMDASMDFAKVTVGGDMQVATASGTGAFGIVVGDGTTINQYIRA